MRIPRLGSASGDGLHKALPPRMPFYSLWAEENGLSHLATCMLDGFIEKSVGAKAAPMWTREFPEDVETIFFLILPVGWVGEWRESPGPQWVVPLRASKWAQATFIGAKISARLPLTATMDIAPDNSVRSRASN
jgi:hypothetical protein